MTDEQLSAVLAAVRAVELAVQNASEAILQGPLPVQASEIALEAAQYQGLQEQLTVQNNITVVLICCVSLGVGVALGQILARWFK